MLQVHVYGHPWTYGTYVDVRGRTWTYVDVRGRTWTYVDVRGHTCVRTGKVPF